MSLLIIIFFFLAFLALGFIAQPFFATPTGYGPIRRFKGFLPIAVVLMLLSALCYHWWGNYTGLKNWTHDGKKQYESISLSDSQHNASNHL